MADNMTILVGTSGQGVLRSADGGDNWRRISIDQGLHSDAVVRCLAVHPNKPNLIYAGTDKGIYTSTDAGEHWALSDNLLNDYTVWALVIDDEDPNLIYAGTGTHRVFPLSRRRKQLAEDLHGSGGGMPGGWHPTGDRNCHRPHRPPKHLGWH